MKVLLGLLAACFITVTVLTTWEGGLAVIFGWIPYLRRVLPSMSADWGSIAVGGGAILLFAAGVHAMGFTWRQRPTDAGMPVSTWRFRSTFSVVAIVIVLFTAGISIIGIVHQTGWLIRSDGSLYGETLPGRGVNASHNLREIGLALHSHHDLYRRLPAGGTFGPDGTMLHSWETHCLFGLSYSAEIDMTKPWNDPVNQKYFKCIIPAFINSGLNSELEDKEGYGLSHYAANSHIMGGNRSMKLTDIKDGAANTLLIGEVNTQFKPWGHPVNWRDPTAGINRSPRGFGGLAGSGGANFVMADCSIRFVSDKISPDVLRAMSTPNDGEEVREEGWHNR